MGGRVGGHDLAQEGQLEAVELRQGLVEHQLRTRQVDPVVEEQGTADEREPRDQGHAHGHPGQAAIHREAHRPSPAVNAMDRATASAAPAATASRL